MQKSYIPTSFNIFGKSYFQTVWYGYPHLNQWPSVHEVDRTQTCLKMILFSLPCSILTQWVPSWLGESWKESKQSINFSVYLVFKEELNLMLVNLVKVRWVWAIRHWFSFQNTCKLYGLKKTQTNKWILALSPFNLGRNKKS